MVVDLLCVVRLKSLRKEEWRTRHQPITANSLVSCMLTLTPVFRNQLLTGRFYFPAPSQHFRLVSNNFGWRTFRNCQKRLDGYPTAATLSVVITSADVLTQTRRKGSVSASNEARYCWMLSIWLMSSLTLQQSSCTRSSSCSLSFLVMSLKARTRFSTCSCRFDPS